ncbi:uncharacterized protein PHALS_02627 [Plasmopara halstedii]|uniref:Uncharacterized protein n=1 Tax=Plasmopara halstedii TaxID=4781 RepID=A0A0P1AZ74_PLAHL|nr:uncharacterized protein PHALS_02627 [Plasmopara halstedii]CEG46212.1 hypothetical protein PHALS_02627 [Plasmopara halstedii]|eukprot:XP_024582581.1 hypothetical protein PHALS_02627 [Plasmopara halstedii]
MIINQWKRKRLMRSTSGRVSYPELCGRQLEGASQTPYVWRLVDRFPSASLKPDCRQATK